MFIRAGDLDPNKKHPMLLLIHGGPFASAPYHIFGGMRMSLLLQGYCLLIINYRGSLGFGEDCLNTLIGNIGENDVKDCIDLTKLACE